MGPRAAQLAQYAVIAKSVATESDPSAINAAGRVIRVYTGQPRDLARLTSSALLSVYRIDYVSTRL